MASSSSNVGFKRLQKELIAIKKNPVENILAQPNENNMLEWHYVVIGPRDTVYEGGYYHGVLRFPTEYPYKPPSIMMYTTNGRFKTHTRLCLSMSDYHPETWNPMWSVSSILSGLLSFMIDNQTTMGAIDATDNERRAYARNSLKENCENVTFKKMFPELVLKYEEMKMTQRETAAQVETKPVAKEPEKKNDLHVMIEPPPRVGGGTRANGQSFYFYSLGVLLVFFSIWFAMKEQV